MKETSYISYIKKESFKIIIEFHSNHISKLFPGNCISNKKIKHKNLVTKSSSI